MPDPEAPVPAPPPMTLKEERAFLLQRVDDLTKLVTKTPGLVQQMIVEYDKTVDVKLNKLLDTIIEQAAKNRPLTSTPPTAPPADQGGISGLLESAKPFIQTAKDMGLIGGGSSSNPLGVDFAEIFQELQNLAIKQVKNDYRRKLGLPILADHVNTGDHA